jgi:hypothetical protein
MRRITIERIVWVAIAAFVAAFGRDVYRWLT